MNTTIVLCMAPGKGALIAAGIILFCFVAIVVLTIIFAVLYFARPQSRHRNIFGIAALSLLLLIAILLLGTSLVLG